MRSRFLQLKSPRTIVVLAVVVAALAVAPAASAWTWGYNNIGPVSNTTVVAGWNFWAYTDADKRNGGRIYRRWQTQAGNWCEDYIDGITGYFSTPSDCGYGGYLYLRYGYVYGSKSYTYLEAYS